MKRQIQRYIAAGFFIAILFLLGCSDNKPGEKIIGNTKTGEGNDTVKIGLEIGNRAPELAFSSPDGKIMALSALRGKMVLVDFWQPGACRAGLKIQTWCTSTIHTRTGNLKRGMVSRSIVSHST